MYIVRARFRWRPFADHRLAADQRRAARCARSTQCLIDRVDVVSIHVAHDVPAVGGKTRRRVVAEPLRDVAVDRDAVVVVQHRELVELQGAGKRRRLVRDAFHQAAVSGKHVSAVIHDRVAGPVEFTREQRLGERHADRVGQSLPEWSRGRFDAGCDAHLRMPRRLAVQLPEAPEFVDRQVVAGEMQQSVQQHRAMPVRQHEAVAIGPRRIARIVFQMAVPQRDGNLGHAERHARMTRFSGFDRIDREHA